MRKRNIRVWARLTEDEHNILMRRIRKTVLSKEAYIRSVLLGSVPREKPDERFYAIMSNLSDIAHSTSQLAREAVNLGIIDAPMLQREAEKWSQFQLAVRRAFLLPDRIV